jgi:predicted ArsR family transcriptional regulator
MFAPGLGESQRQIMETLKRGGPATVPRLAHELGLNVETLRAHLKTLAGHGLVSRRPGVRRGRGRPEVVFGLTDGAESLFPRREGELLRDLAGFLRQRGHGDLLREFLEAHLAERRPRSLARVAGLAGRDRVEEVARILSELGFMAHVEAGAPGTGAAAAADAADAADAAEDVRLRLCHCPMRDLVSATKVPCRLEQAFIAELLGEPLTRLSYIPAGDASCSYRRGLA